MKVNGCDTTILQVTPVLHSGGAEHVAAFLAQAFPVPGAASLVSIKGGALSNYLKARGIEFGVLGEDWKNAMLYCPLLVSCKRLLKTVLKPRCKATFHSQVVLSPQWNLLSEECPDYVERFASFLRLNHYELVHVHSLTSAALFRIAKLAGCSVIYGDHYILSERHRRIDLEFLVEQLQWVDHVVCPTQVCKDDFVTATGFPEAKVSVIANPSFLATGVLKQWGGRLLVGTASNLQAAKGIEDLLRAWVILKARGLRFKLQIAGGNPDVVNLWQKVAQQLGLRDDVRFLGTLEESGMIQFYDGTDLIVIPSHTESFSLLAVEAMSRGIPVIASDIPALQEVLSDAGRFFPAGDPTGLADCLGPLLQEPSLLQAIGVRCFDRWQTHYSTGRIILTYEELYRSQLAGCASDGRMGY